MPHLSSDLDFLKVKALVKVLNCANVCYFSSDNQSPR